MTLRSTEPGQAPREGTPVHDPPPGRNEVVILTGMSGAGRTTAGDVLEDRGWYVVDNLPPTMIPSLMKVTEDDPKRQKVAAIVDVRSRDFTVELARALKLLTTSGWRPRVVFVDASDEALVRRFDAVRRPHPLQGEGLLLDGIRRERRMLAQLHSDADVIVDTSNYNVHQLTAKIDSLLSADDAVRLRLALMSFGFKYGIPLDADVVLDLRFLPNPYWDPELRPYTGKDAAVRDFVLGQQLAVDYLAHAEQLIRVAVQGYLLEGRRYFTVALGCTGGKHRSVAAAEELARRLSDITDLGAQLTAFHRDLGRE
ncbi:MAG: RNase adapter RapZ [Ornithinimicrobium sp.]|uniref:RNase adapter RapZ n=1 Tax=Ornithinimicrobium sp. TaxID=1977084 RepID=UPI0026DEED44|nr:RNase adapter RapZ [Ornithinimicrobium sp.]MDO5738680.1 RNase adapter RapZ [Ornithinimicrobium sp.]